MPATPVHSDPLTLASWVFGLKQGGDVTVHTSPDFPLWTSTLDFHSGLSPLDFHSRLSPDFHSGHSPDFLLWTFSGLSLDFLLFVYIYLSLCNPLYIRDNNPSPALQLQYSDYWRAGELPISYLLSHNIYLITGEQFTSVLYHRDLPDTP